MVSRFSGLIRAANDMSIFSQQVKERGPVSSFTCN